MIKSELADRFFRQFIAEHVKQATELPVDDLLDGARNAFTLKYAKSVDQKTFEKALDAVCNPINGDYENDEGIVKRRNKGG